MIAPLSPSAQRSSLLTADLRHRRRRPPRHRRDRTSCSGPRVRRFGCLVPAVAVAGERVGLAQVQTHWRMRTKTSRRHDDWRGSLMCGQRRMRLKRTRRRGCN